MSRRRRPSAGRRAVAPHVAAALFAALGDETRLALVSRLRAGEPMSITKLAEGSNVTRQAITKHLLVLSDAGLVHGVRRGREMLWELEPEKVHEAREWLDEISRQWDVALDRLREMVEDDT